MVTGEGVNHGCLPPAAQGNIQALLTRLQRQDEAWSVLGSSSAPTVIPSCLRLVLHRVPRWAIPSEEAVNVSSTFRSASPLPPERPCTG